MITSIVVNYRCAELTSRAVGSLLRDMPEAHVIVVDNSEEATETALLHARLPYPGVQLLVSPRNIGFGAACNLGMQASSSAYVMLLNPDASVVPGCLSVLSACLDSDAQLGAVSPMQWWDPGGHWLLPPAWLPTGPGMWAIEAAWRCPRRAWNLSMAYRRLAIQTWTGRAGCVHQRALSGGAVMVRRAAILPCAGLFDPAFFMYYEDSDLSLRLRQSGWMLGLAPRAAAVHEWENTPGKSALMEKSKEIYLDKHFEHGEWRNRLNACADAQPALSNPLNAQRLEPGTLAMEVPARWQAQWLLEVSPSPLMVPAIGRWGCGPSAELPPHLMRRFGVGPVYVRLGSVDRVEEKTLGHWVWNA